MSWGAAMLDDEDDDDIEEAMESFGSLESEHEHANASKRRLHRKLSTFAYEIETQIVQYIQSCAVGCDPEGAAQLHAVADGILEGRHLPKDKPMDARVEYDIIKDSVSETVVGPVRVDLDMARALGWSPNEMAICAAFCAAASRLESSNAAARLGHTRVCPVCECWTVPKALGDCHMCSEDKRKADQRIHDELLQGIVRCPHCGAKARRPIVGSETHFNCSNCGGNWQNFQWRIYAPGRRDW